MKTLRPLLTVLIAMACAAMAAAAENTEKTIPLSDVPAPVQKTIEASRERGTLKKIIRREIDGQTVYDVEFERNNAPNPHLRIVADGTIFHDTSPPVVTQVPWPMSPDYVGAVPPVPPLRLEDLPAPVQETVRREAAGRAIGDIDHESWKGRSVYEVEFRQSGLNPQIHVAEDGTLLQDERAGKGLKSLFMGTQLEDTPPAVQERIRSLSGEREISDIDREGTADLVIYEVAIKDDQGIQRVRISEKGEVLSDSRLTAPHPRKP